MKTIYKIIIPLIILIVSYFYIASMKYQIYEVTADNVDKLKQLENINIFETYDRIIPHYKGFGNMQHINYGVKKNINIKNNYYAKYVYLGETNGVENYNIYLKDCTVLTIKCERENNVKSIYQRGGEANCYDEANLFQERINYLKLHGFIEKESVFKYGQSILIRDSNPYYFYIVHIKEINKKLAALTFKVYSKNKFPKLKIW